jgi:hypothetical protein
MRTCMELLLILPINLSQEIVQSELLEPQGWVHLSLPVDQASITLCNVLQVYIHSNHQNGRDTHLRGIKLWGSRERYESRGLCALYFKISRGMK